MSRTKKSASLDNRTNRLKLPVATRNQTSLTEGLYLMYRRPRSGQAGAWTARWWEKTTKEEKQVRLGDADDFLDADGIRVLTYKQAQDKAEEWFKVLVRRSEQEKAGEVIHHGPYSVSDAWADYIRDAERRGVKGIKIMGQVFTAQIQPVLGGVEVSKLTRGRIEKWHEELSKSPRRTGKKFQEDAREESPKAQTQDEIRARRDTANRILTNLKAALNYALDSGKVQEPAPWKLVKPFKNTTSKRIRVLTVTEQRALVNACEPDFKILVMAALFTGARYGELAKVKVKDFHSQDLFIQWGKGKGDANSRHVFLTAESVTWFKALVKGKSGEQLLFQRKDVERTTREELKDFDGWAAYDQNFAMAKAVKKAGIDPVTFHELRHTYASGLLNQGVPLAYVASQLGHKDTRMCERHYGHIGQGDMQASIQRLAPRLDLTREPKAAKNVKAAKSAKL